MNEGREVVANWKDVWGIRWFLVASLTARSTASLPAMLLCPGAQMKVTLPLGDVSQNSTCTLAHIMSRPT